MDVISKFTLLLIIYFLQTTGNLFAAVLPEERADIMYHRYDGGGITIDGPSILVRKNIDTSFSLSAKYYVDNVSSASIDVITQASPYTEDRTELGISADYLYDKSILSYSFSNSTERDFEANTNSFNISQEVFGGLTTITLGYSSGRNAISKSTDPAFSKQSSVKGYRLSLSQVLTKDTLLGLTYEIITDKGFLNNPYRSVRYLDGTGGTAFQLEVYPETRTSNSMAVNLRYYLPHRAAVYGSYRFFTDTWDIEANTYEIGYVYPYESNWLFDFNIRYYDQNKANFYANLFPFFNAQSFLGSDKELSTFSNNSYGAGLTYTLGKDNLLLFQKGTINFYLTHIIFEYDDFLNIPAGGVPGQEPEYSFSTNIMRFYASFWF